MPLEMKKAAALWYKTLITQPEPSGAADVQVLREMAAVCRYWKLTIAMSNRQQLRRFFSSE